MFNNYYIMDFIKLSNKIAKNEIMNLITKKNIIVDPIYRNNLSYWYYNDTALCYVICHPDIVNFALISKYNIIRNKTYRNVYRIDYIHTLEEHRNKYYALNMLNYLKERENIICIDPLKNIQNILIKSNFKLISPTLNIWKG